MECPSCGHEFLPGQDACDHCREDLTHVSFPGPKRGRLHNLILEDPLSQLNAPRPIVLKSSDSAARAAELMKKYRFGSVLVLDAEGKLAGIFTERDLLRKTCGSRTPLQRIQLEDVMTKRPRALGEEDSIAQAINQMAVGGYRHVPVVRAGEPVGFVSIRGILAYIAQNAL